MAAKKKPRLKTKPPKPHVDGWENTLTGIGRSRDKRTSTVIASTIIPGSRDEFDEWYHGDHTAAKIAKLPAREMTREWITFQVDDSVDTAERMLVAKRVMQALDDLQVKSRFFEALLWARVHGGSLVLLGVNDGEEDLAEPLNMNNLRSLDYLTVFDRWEAQIQTYQTELKGGQFGEPETYLLVPQTASAAVSMSGVIVHASRFIRFEGVPTSRYRQSLLSGWSDSVYTAMRETLQDYGISWHGVAHLLQDFSQAVFKMRGLAEAIAEQESNLVLDRLTAMDLCRSVARAIPIDAESEEFVRVATPLTDLPAVLDRLMLRLSEAAEMPATLLFGQSPSGLQATGESDIRFFYDSIHAKQEAELRPRIDRLLDVLLASKEGPTGGQEPENWSYEFNPLWQETDKQRAETRKLQAETDSIYLSDGVLDPDEVAQSRFGGDTYSSETVLDTEKREAAAMADDNPEETAEAEAEITQEKIAVVVPSEALPQETTPEE